jgi:hypothetical protein
MTRGERRGLDYTPLFQFLLSRVGEDWNDIFREARSRLDREEPIWWMVARSVAEHEGYFSSGPSSYFSELYVDEHGRLRKIDPAIGPETLVPWCGCCQHTFNGLPFVKSFSASRATD